MRTTPKLLVAGTVMTLAVMAGSHRHGSGHRRRRGRHGAVPLLDQPQWRGLTEPEARTRLAEHLDGEGAVDEAIADLDARGLLHRSS